MPTRQQNFQSIISRQAAKKFVRLPFDPDLVWGVKPRHQISGSVNGIPVRGPLTRAEDGWLLLFGPAWLRDSGLAEGDSVTVVLEPEGLQTDELDPDLFQALAAEPEARYFFDSLSTFYRKAYLRWVGVKNPALRASRIVEMVALLKAGRKMPS